MTVLPAPLESRARGRTETDVARDRTPLLLDGSMAVSVGSGLVTVWAFAHTADVPRAWTAGYLALVLGMTLLWVARRVWADRSRAVGRTLVVALAVLGTANLFLGGGAGAWPLFLMGLLATVACLGWRGGVVLCATALGAQLVALLLSDRSVEETVLEVGSAAFAAAFGLLLAWLLTERERQQRRIGALLAEVRQGLTSEIELVLADERTRAARDLHDGLGHRLTLIGMELAYAERVRDRDPEGAWAQVERARAGSSEALTSMRRWVRALSPARIEGVDLGQGLDAVAQSFRGTGLDVVVRGPGAPVASGTPLDRATTLFVHRFVQEALTNALRHAEPTRIEVTYEDGSDGDAGRDGGVLSLSVSDDGSPGPADRTAPVPGFGLRTLGERARELGGSVTTTWSASGLRVVAVLPRGGRA